MAIKYWIKIQTKRTDKKLPLLHVAQVAWDMRLPLYWQEMDFILMQLCVS